MNNKPMNTFATNLRMQRARLDLSQAQLAAKSGVSMATIGNIEGSKTMPALDTMEALAVALGIRVADLFAELPEQQT